MNLSFPPPPPPLRRHVAVVGAGVSGLVAARELHREGHLVSVFESNPSPGGTWIYTPATESDLVGLDPNRRTVQSSLYSSLRTNLPREAMGFSDYPFGGKGREGLDPRRFPGHKEVLRYLEGFVKEFGVGEMVRFGREVERVEREDGRWRVWISGDNQQVFDFDAVVVCNGHYTIPRLADVPGVAAWPGKQIHSHNYRVPEEFLDQVVVLIGNSASAVDISRDISGFATEVHVASRSDTREKSCKQDGYDNIWLHPMIKMANEDGTVTFQDGSSVHVDIILHCTGYKYHFPFLKIGDIVTVDDNRVGPLYKHVFPPLLSPGLSFIGLPWKVIPFPLYELQSKWVAAVLSGRVSLPTEEEMLEDVEVYYAEMEAKGYPKRYTHNLSSSQFDYDDWLASQCGLPPIEEWRKQMYVETVKTRLARPNDYRDVWEDEHLIEQANRDFEKLLGSRTDASSFPNSIKGDSQY